LLSHPSLIFDLDPLFLAALPLRRRTTADELGRPSIGDLDDVTLAFPRSCHDDEHATSVFL
jgi:hypothetical protein